MDSHLNMIGGQISNILAEISPLMKHMGQKTRNEIEYAKAASLVLYGSELFTGQSEWTRSRYTAIMMRCNRCIYHKDWFKVSNRRICDDIGIDQPDQICRKLTLRNFHKIIWHKAPPQIFNLVKFNNKHRDCSNLNLIYLPSKQTSKKTVLENALELFNNLPAGMKFMSHKKLKIALTKMSI